MTTKEVEDTKYIIETCDSCCGRLPNINRMLGKQIEIYCTNCGRGVESDMLWKTVTLWNQMVRKAEVGKKKKG